MSGAHGPLAGRSDRYDMFGSVVAVSGAPAEVLDAIAGTFAAFRTAPDPRPPELELRVTDRGDRALIEEIPHGPQRLEPPATLLWTLFQRLDDVVFAALSRRDIVAVHAAAVESDGVALVLAGPSGRGKSTLALGLVQAGLRLLSDDLALIGPDGVVHPYRRSVLIRPGTPELLPELGPLGPAQDFGGGVRWALTPERLERSFAGCLAPSAPLRGVLLLERSASGTPSVTASGPGSSAVELLGGTPLAAHDLPRALRRLGCVLNRAACARLDIGGFDPTVAATVEWLRTATA